MVDITDNNVERVLDEGKCHCGQPYMILKIKGQKSPHALHHNPPCQSFQTMPKPQWLEWVKTGQRPEPPKPNRKARRQIARQAKRSPARVR